jgi:hypothetical protein
VGVLPTPPLHPEVEPKMEVNVGQQRRLGRVVPARMVFSFTTPRRFNRRTGDN